MNLKDFCLTLCNLIAPYGLIHLAYHLFRYDWSHFRYQWWMCVLSAPKHQNSLARGWCSSIFNHDISNTLDGSNVEQFLSNYPHLNANWPHRNTMTFQKINLRIRWTEQKWGPELNIWNVLDRPIIRSSIWYFIIIHDKKYWVKWLRDRRPIFVMCSIFFILMNLHSEKELFNYLLRYINTFKNDSTLSA